MGITYETPEEKQAIMDSIKADYKSKLGIESDDDNPILDELVKTEFGRRETQAAFTKKSQSLKEVTAEKNFLMDQVQSKLDLSTVQNEELEKLKIDDPDKWRDTIGKLEHQAKEDFDKTISDGLGHARSEASKDYELSRRKEVLEDFVKANPDFDINDEKVRDQIPPLYINQLAEGEITFEDFLTKAQKFVIAAKITKTETPEGGSKALDKMQGSSKPDSKAIKNQTAEDYENTIL